MLPGNSGSHADVGGSHPDVRAARRHRKSEQGATLVEAVVTLSILSLMLLVVLQMALLTNRQVRANSDMSIGHRALRETLISLTKDLPLAYGAAPEGDGTVILVDGEGLAQVTYVLEQGGQLRRTRREGAAVVSDRVIAYNLKTFALEINESQHLVNYHLAVPTADGRDLVVKGSIFMRNAALAEQ